MILRQPDMISYATSFEPTHRVTRMSSATQENLVTSVRKFLQDTTFCHCMFIINNRMKVTTINTFILKKIM
jgi:hypothetical protein